MKIIVSVKQVPDTSGKVAVNPDGTLNRASMQTITNPDDMNARGGRPEASRTPPAARSSLSPWVPRPLPACCVRLLAMGADEARAGFRP